jgi:hypothetical protein
MVWLVLDIFKPVLDKFQLQYMGSNAFKELVVDHIIQCIGYE